MATHYNQSVQTSLQTSFASVTPLCPFPEELRRIALAGIASLPEDVARDVFTHQSVDSTHNYQKYEQLGDTLLATGVSYIAFKEYPDLDIHQRHVRISAR